MNIKETDKKFVAGTYKRFPVALVAGKGSVLTDTDGKNYIDMGSGIAVNSFGIADEKWQEAVIEQIKKLQHTSNLYYSEPCAKLARMLCEKTGMKKVFFSNSGAEANECAIKAARKYAADKKGPEFFKIITLKNSFHGRTLTCLAANGQEAFHKLFQPLTPGFLYAEANNLEEVKALIQENKVAAVMLECVQGEGGVTALEPDYLRALAAYVKEKDILLIIDEVQTGNGRTGKLYSYMHFDIQPDIVSTAKGLGGGLPLGATLLGDKVENVLGFGDHGSTFGGNPVSCNAAVSILERIDEKLLAEVREKSKFLFDSFQGAEGIESVSGMGLMLGLKTVKPAADVLNACMEKGVLCLTAKDKVRLLPALNIPMDLLEKAVGIIKECCK